jgi:hypothetical protein
MSRPSIRLVAVLTVALSIVGTSAAGQAQPARVYRVGAMNTSPEQ